MAKVSHTKSSEPIGEAKALPWPSCIDVSGSEAKALLCLSYADVSLG